MTDNTDSNDIPQAPDEGVAKMSALEKRIAAAQRAKLSIEARDDFLKFVKFTMPDVEDPENVEVSMFKDAKHHRALAKVLEKVEKGHIPRLIVTLPPRHGKTELISRRFIPWLLGRAPYRNIIFATYNEPFSQDIGSDCRNIMQSPHFKQVFPKFRFRAGGLSREKLQAGEGGMAAFVGKGGSITGRGADCIVEGSLVETAHGQIPIENLYDAPSSCMILSYNHSKGVLEYRKLQAIQSREADGFYRITTASGRSLEVTGNHRILVGGQYKFARDVSPGDAFMQLLPDSVQPSGQSVFQGAGTRARGPLLQQGLLAAAPRNQESQGLPVLRKSGSIEWSLQGRQILRGVQAAIAGAQGCVRAAGKAVSDLWAGVFGQVAHGQIRGVLRKTVCANWALQAHGGQAQSKVEGWGHAFAPAAAFGQGFSGNAPAGAGARWLQVRGLFGGQRQAGGASHRQLADEQRRQQSGDAVQSVPPSLARGHGFQAVEDIVAVVERVREATRVYDIQVEGNHNFFASGVCVHNCLIIDDPIKDSEEAQSVTQRQKLWDWFTQVAMTRLMTKFACVVVVHTRWHEDDLIGRLTDPGNPCYSETEAAKWKIINLPAISRDADPLGRAPGEALWPERFDLEFLNAAKTLDPKGFSALYQQQPTPEDGDLFRADWIVHYEKSQLPPDLRIYAASDHAIGEDKTRNDATCMIVGGVDQYGDIYLLDVWWEKAGADKQVEAMLRLAKQWKPMLWFAEKGHISKAIGPFLRKRMQEERQYFTVEEVTPIGNKVQRAQSIMGRMSMKKVKFPKHAPWAIEARDELLKFPNARHDDFVDALAWLGRAVDRMSTPTRVKPADGGPKYGTLGWLKADAAHRAKQQRLATALKGW